MRHLASYYRRIYASLGLSKYQSRTHTSQEHDHDFIGMQLPLYLRVLTARPSADAVLTTELYMISA